ncbi:hypothetical protein [Micromonospora sp. HUAS LYJ1]|uniref:hypothetical protein n=1 Tax=Micromonospora sp. HUAS LYJ1 TaxID=3061626 RepID=UPI002672092F|nr:hypothetical protein [Micromonospora sp. HUAS LYJ1]WKU08638.1 hypothetical protein Q2K16_20155 [Micromonospora sp. HUAS LYJ1]
MVYLPAARRHHRSRLGHAFGLLVLIGAVLTLVVVTRYPAESATRLAEPVPAPEITVAEPADAPTGDAAGPQPDPAPPADRRTPVWAENPPGDGLRAEGDLRAEDDASTGGDPASGNDPTTGPGGDAGAAPGAAQSGVGGGGASALAEPRHPSDDRQTVARSLFYSGLLGLAISLAGLGLVGTRRRMW